MTYLINLSHPLTDDQQAQIQEVVPGHIDVREISVHFDLEKPFYGQVYDLVKDAFDGVPGSERIIINPPGLGVVAALVMAELHLVYGRFPEILRLRPVAGAIPPRYEVVEIIDIVWPPAKENDEA